MRVCLLICTIILAILSYSACSNMTSAEMDPSKELSIIVNGESVELVRVTGGTFIMGCTDLSDKESEDDERPHEETVSDFYIGKYEVTQKLWCSIMGTDNNYSYNLGCENCPVERVSWKDAQDFISKLNNLTGRKFRLPTDVEWEYAARGGKRSRGYKYSGSNLVDEVAWYIDNYQKESISIIKATHPVGQKSPNELGIFDMSGNVWEWCENLYKNEYWQNNKQVHQGWPYPGIYSFFRRIIRGGSWGGEALGCRVTYIDFDFESYKDEYGGFRLVMDINN